MTFLIPAIKRIFIRNIDERPIKHFAVHDVKRVSRDTVNVSTSYVGRDGNPKYVHHTLTVSDIIQEIAAMEMNPDE